MLYSSPGPPRRFNRVAFTAPASTNDAWTHAPAVGGSTMRYHFDGSSCLAFFKVISSSTVTLSPFFKRPTISLLNSAWPRMFTLACFATAGSA